MLLSFGSVGLRHLDVSLVAICRDTKLPGIAADLAVLDERAPDLGLEIDLDLFAAVRARDVELRIHEEHDITVGTRSLCLPRGALYSVTPIIHFTSRDRSLRSPGGSIGPEEDAR